MSSRRQVDQDGVDLLNDLVARLYIKTPALAEDVRLLVEEAIERGDDGINIPDHLEDELVSGPGEPPVTLGDWIPGTVDLLLPPGDEYHATRHATPSAHHSTRHETSGSSRSHRHEAPAASSRSHRHVAPGPQHTHRHEIPGSSRSHRHETPVAPSRSHRHETPGHQHTHRHETPVASSRSHRHETPGPQHTHRHETHGSSHTHRHETHGSSRTHRHETPAAPSHSHRHGAPAAPSHSHRHGTPGPQHAHRHETSGSSRTHQHAHHAHPHQHAHPHHHAHHDHHHHASSAPRRSRNAAPAGAGGPQDIISQLTRPIVTQTMLDDNDTTCAICQDDLNVGDEVILLPCTHWSFHSACLEPWLRRSNTCPTCRLPVEYES
ncbi:hypothetical protein N7466_008510 [Penicillium verhagenii]|uniref:uncharacterized protein n=1 Tax=Penicillium verhagenii TaxID=1562060 RepID=UPI00254571A7|nr:uncharacterized protein N7466_008510 [Penicillium verhagenii]KAJ5924323.1 hypothetical protein N7466_008510 [Penicillium verhagenii]